MLEFWMFLNYLYGGCDILAKNKGIYQCDSCGFESAKWYGKCPSCGEWNCMQEHKVTVTSNSSKTKRSINFSEMDKAQTLSQISLDKEHRYHTGLNELDRVLGGGIVKGSLVLLGGDPGIGKSTILLQICEYLGQNSKILYISGEESKRQLKMRADRLNVKTNNLYFASQTDIEIIMESIKSEKPDFAIVDSIQTTSFSELNSSPGSITQVRECTNALMHLAKSLEIPIFVVGHVNKDGAIAGPKVLEHIVDAVLHFEGDRQFSYRILRAVKNRFGSTNEIAVFEMEETGLHEVENPSLMLLSGRPTNVSGTCVSCLMEGSRPILAEVQALVSKAGFNNPRRMATGFDYNRMSLIIAVLEKRAKYFFYNMDAYINVIGGLRIDEPAADLSIALSLVSSLKDKPLPDDMVAFGELGLAGELRAVSNARQRILEAERLGFKSCILPYHNFKKLKDLSVDINLIPAYGIKDAFEKINK